MAKNVYALLIAINDYQHPVPKLNGCVQDSNEVKAYLEGTIPSDKLKLQVLHDADATRKNVIDAFLSHLTQADEEDSVFIHYAGHGSQEKTMEAFYDLEPDRKNETLVLVDSRQTINNEYHRDLADKELRALIHQVARKKPHIVAIFDCCHAGSNTRSTAKVTKRQASDDKTNARSLREYVFMERDEFSDSFQPLFSDEKTKVQDLPTGSHIALQAALSSQTAKELVIDGKKRGIFTYSLLKTLKESQGDITYTDLLNRASAFVLGKVAEQNPLVDVVFSAKTTGAKPSGDMVFLKGSLKPAEKSYLVRWDKKLGSYTVAAGQLHGIPSNGTTRFAIYDSQANISENASEYLQIANSKQVQASQTTISIEGTGALDKEATFKATILSLPVENKTKVYFEAETPAEADAVQLLASAFEQDESAQKYLERVNPDQEADYRIMAYRHEGEEKFGFFRPTDTAPLTAPIVGFNSRQAEGALMVLSGIARWSRVKDMTNLSTNIPQGTLQMEIEAHHYDPQTDQLVNTEPIKPNDKGEIAIRFQHYNPKVENSWGRTPVYKIKAKNNHASNSYYVAILALSSDFSIQNIIFGQNLLGPGESIAAAGGDTLAPEISEALLNKGIRQDTGYLKLVASTEPFDPGLLEQAGFEYPTQTRSVGAEGPTDSFTMLLEAQKTRALALRKPKKITDWTTELVSFTSIQDDEAAHKQVAARSLVKVQLPDGANGNIRLSNLGQTSRSVQAEMPASQALSAFPHAAPLELIPGQQASPGMEVLEIEGLDRSQVTSENPLTLTFDTRLKSGEKSGAGSGGRRHPVAYPCDSQCGGQASDHAGENTRTICWRAGHR